MRHCAENFLASDHKEVRLEAVRTCSRLLTPLMQVFSASRLSRSFEYICGTSLSYFLFDPPSTVLQLVDISGYWAHISHIEIEPEVTQCGLPLDLASFVGQDFVYN